jgi:ribonuclease P protein component
MPPAADNSLKNSFRKRDRLKSSLEIEALYRENQFIVSYPLKCYYSFSEIVENRSHLRVAFAVPKRLFKLATDRNTIRRRMRETYRLHYKKVFETLINQKEKQLKLFFIYVGKEISDYKRIEKNMLAILKNLCKSVSSASSVC